MVKRERELSGNKSGVFVSFVAAPLVAAFRKGFAVSFRWVLVSRNQLH